MEIEKEKAKVLNDSEFSKSTLPPEDLRETKKKIRMERQFTRYDNKSKGQACCYWIRLGFTLYILYLGLVLIAIIFPFAFPYYSLQDKIKNCSLPPKYLAIFLLILAGFIFSPIFWSVITVLYAIGLVFALIYYPILGTTMCCRQFCHNSRDKTANSGFTKFQDEEQTQV